MTYKLRETTEAIEDVTNFATYMIDAFKNRKAAIDFLNEYDVQIQRLKTFPFGYRGVKFEYQGYEIRIKPYDTYNIFFTVDTANQEIIVLRVLKNRQDWKSILDSNKY